MSPETRNTIIIWIVASPILYFIFSKLFSMIKDGLGENMYIYWICLGIFVLFGLIVSFGIYSNRPK